LIDIVKKPLGTAAQSPPSPPSPVPAPAMLPVDPVLVNLNEGLIRWIAVVTWRFDGSSVIAAGLYQATLESSAVAAPPAKALPVPLPLWVPMPKPPAAA